MQMRVKHGLVERMRGAALLDIATYEEVEADTSATTQAAIAVGIVAIAAAIGGAREGAAGLVAGMVSAYAGWALWAGLTYLIGTRLGGTATWGELLRTLGFAQAPGLLYALGIIPILGGLASFVAWIWLLIASVVAIRQALDFGTGRALLTALIGFIPYVFLSMLIGWILGVRPNLI